MRPWTILEAFAERIVRLGAHRSSWRNGISEGSHKPFCSQHIVRAAAYPISFKWKLASRRETHLRMLNPSFHAFLHQLHIMFRVLPVCLNLCLCQLPYHLRRIAKCHGIVRNHHFPGHKCTTAPLNRILPIPITELSPTVHPCTTAL